MLNEVYLKIYSTQEELQKGCALKLPLVSFLTYSVFKYCSPREISLKFVFDKEVNAKDIIYLRYNQDIEFVDSEMLPWQVESCIYPVVLCDDTIITGLCAVARHICKYRSSHLSQYEHEDGLLGFRRGCLQAPNEVSIWTKFCEVDLIRSVKELMNTKHLEELPKNLVRFENHLGKPVKVHNVYKLARDIKKENLKLANESSNDPVPDDNGDDKKSRQPKNRKWKSKSKKELEINCSIRIEDLEISHQFAEGPFLTLADVILLPLYQVLVETLGKSVFESLLPLTYKWFKNITCVPEMETVTQLCEKLIIKPVVSEELIIPSTEDVSLYKCDPKRHNPKKRMFTKEEDIEQALHVVNDGMELSVTKNEFEDGIDWNTIPDGANPSAGHLPDERMTRKSQQLENLVLAVIKLAKKGDLIVDFCSGSGHLGILIAHLLPECTVILLENKEQSLLRAKLRVNEMGLKNVYFFQCNLDFFIGKFDIGIALHACGIASDLVLDKCLKANAKFVLCPCCYGSLHTTDRLVYPRSKAFQKVSIDQYLCLGHAADQTHEDHPLMVRGARCMAIIDSDRGRLAEEFGYKVTLSRLKPLTCTPKNNLIVGVPA